MVTGVPSSGMEIWDLSSSCRLDRSVASSVGVLNDSVSVGAGRGGAFFESIPILEPIMDGSVQVHSLGQGEKKRWVALSGFPVLLFALCWVVYSPPNWVDTDRLSSGRQSGGRGEPGTTMQGYLRKVGGSRSAKCVVFSFVKTFGNNL